MANSEAYHDYAYILYDVQSLCDSDDELLFMIGTVPSLRSIIISSIANCAFVLRTERYG